MVGYKPFVAGSDGVLGTGATVVLDESRGEFATYVNERQQ
jgi:hypothetical protein